MAALGQSAALADPFGVDEETRAKPATVLQYEVRRCHICRCPQPAFGFGPPLTRPGQELWACGQHREAVEALLSPRKPRGLDAFGTPTLL